MTPAERKAAERQRKRDAGLVRLEIWVPAHLHQIIKDFVAKLMGQ